MAKELYIYSDLYDFTAETTVKQLNEVAESEDLTMRLNTNGGNVMAGWSIISKMSERKAPINAIVDGNAKSMGALMLVFFDKVTANDTSQILFHKAAYPSWYETNESEKAQLKIINDQFKEKLTAKVNGKPGAQAFLDKVFEADVRNDVSVTPMEAKKLGIINEVKILEPRAYHGMQIVALVESEANENKPPKSGDINKPKKVNMTLQELKAEHPALYAQVFEQGSAAGVEIERDRVEAWATFAEVDPKKVAEGISGGKNISQKAMAEFALQGQMNARKADHEEDNADNTDTSKEKKTAQELKAAAEQKVMDEEMEKINAK